MSYSQHNSAENNIKRTTYTCFCCKVISSPFSMGFFMFCLTFFSVSRKLAYFTINLCLLSVGLDLVSIKAAAGDAIMQLRFIGIQEHVRAGICLPHASRRYPSDTGISSTRIKSCPNYSTKKTNHSVCRLEN
jgi:hypothetical protein